MKHIKQRLKEKGWKQKDINHAVKILKEVEHHKPPVVRLVEKSMFGIALFVAVTGNFMVSVALIPLLLTVHPFFLYSILIILGLSFGLLFELLIVTIQHHLQRKHHTILSILVPFFAFLNFFIIVLFTNALNETYQLQNTQNPFVISILYAGSFLIPYLLYRTATKRK